MKKVFMIFDFISLPSFWLLIHCVCAFMLKRANLYDFQASLFLTFIFMLIIHSYMGSIKRVKDNYFQ